MTKIKVKSIIWEEWNLIHIQRHSVTKIEVEIATANIGYHEKANKGRYMIVGRSRNRILSVVVNRISQTTYYVVTARDSDKNERRKLYEKEN